jgi:hypothetical protein
MMFWNADLMAKLGFGMLTLVIVIGMVSRWFANRDSHGQILSSSPTQPSNNKHI